MNKITAAIFACAIAFAAFGEDDPVSLRGVVTMRRNNESYFFMHGDDGRDWRVSMEKRPLVAVAPGDTVEVAAYLEPKRNRHTTRAFMADVKVVGHDAAAIPAPREDGRRYRQRNLRPCRVGAGRIRLVCPPRAGDGAGA